MAGLAGAAIALAGLWAAYEQSQQVPVEAQPGGVAEETLAVDALTANGAAAAQQGRGYSGVDDLMLGSGPAEQAARTGQLSGSRAVPEGIGLAGDAVEPWPADDHLDASGDNMMDPDPTAIAPPPTTPDE